MEIFHVTRDEDMGRTHTEKNREATGIEKKKEEKKTGTGMGGGARKRWRVGETEY